MRPVCPAIGIPRLSLFSRVLTRRLQTTFVYLQLRVMYAFNPSGPTYGQSAAVDAPGSRMIRAASTLYFAYGSNLHLAQMAHRCPGSVFKGKAILDSYRWQINERGVANVVESGSDHSVEGLLYMIGPKDERTLDRSE